MRAGRRGGAGRADITGAVRCAYSFHYNTGAIGERPCCACIVPAVSKQPMNSRAGPAQVAAPMASLPTRRRRVALSASKPAVQWRGQYDKWWNRNALASGEIEENLMRSFVVERLLRLPQQRLRTPGTTASSNVG